MRPNPDPAFLKTREEGVSLRVSALPGLRLSLCLLLGLSACSLENTKSRYLQAENLWRQGKHEASVVEFDRVYRKDPKGQIGLQALFRSGITEALFLRRAPEALRKLQLYLETGPDEEQRYEAARLIADLHFSTLEHYEQAIASFQKLIALRPRGADVAEYLFKIGKAHFFLWKFEDALALYGEVQRRHPESTWAEQATFERGVVLFTQGRERAPASGLPDSGSRNPFAQAISEFQAFLTRYPQSSRRLEAEFNIAQCREEMDQLDLAYSEYLSLLPRYPQPEIIQVKLGRISERRQQKGKPLGLEAKGSRKRRAGNGSQGI